MACLTNTDKLAIVRAMWKIRRDHSRRTDLDRITMLDWLREARQTQNAINRFWRQVLVSAVNEELDRMAAAHGFQVFWLGMLACANSYEMGVPDVPLGKLYSAGAWQRIGAVHIHTRASVERFDIAEGIARAAQTADGSHAADYYICALPFERLDAIAPELGIDTHPFEHSPITGIHLWFDRPVTELANATLLDRTIQWMFNKSQGRYVQFVVSASRALADMSRADVIALALREGQEFFPEIARAKLERAHVIKELRATFSARPGMERLRPGAVTGVRNVFLAGDWTRSGWPATMEGAVRSGYLAAEAVAAASGRPAKFLKHDTDLG